MDRTTKNTLVTKKMPRNLQNLADELEVEPVYVGENLWVAIVYYTPDMASKLLDYRNPNNRKKDKRSSVNYGAAMSRGEFPLTGQTILIDTDANVCDGQGRLGGVALSGETVAILTVFGVNREIVFPAIDRVRSRTLRDALFLDNRERLNIDYLAATIAALYVFFKLGKLTSDSPNKFGVTHKALLDFGNSMGERLDRIVGRIATKSQCDCDEFAIHAGAVGALYWVLSQTNNIKADEFFRGMAQSAMPLDQDRWDGPRRFMRRVKEEMKVGKIKRVIYTALLIKAWNAFASGKLTNQLIWNPEREEYPRIDGVKYNADGTLNDERFKL